MCINNKVDKKKEAGKEILQKANSISYKTIKIDDMTAICKSYSINLVDVMNIINPFITRDGTTMRYKLTDAGVLFIANGFWEKQDTELKYLKNQTKYAAPTFLAALIAAIAGLISTIWIIFCK